MCSESDKDEPFGRVERGTSSHMISNYMQDAIIKLKTTEGKIKSLSHCSTTKFSNCHGKDKLLVGDSACCKVSSEMCGVKLSHV